MMIVSSTVAARSPGFVIYGHEASLEIGTSGERIQLIPEKDFSDDIDLADLRRPDADGGHRRARKELV